MKLNEVEVKNLREFTGHDGGGYWQGDVWLNGKKLGSWSNDAWCGPDCFGFDVHLLDEACRNYKAGFPDSYKYKDVADDPDVFMGAVRDIKLIEKDCKKEFRNGARAVYYMTDNCHISWIPFNGLVTVDYVRGKYPDMVAEMEAQMFENGFTETVFTPDSFDITVDANHPAPEFLMSL